MKERKRIEVESLLNLAIEDFSVPCTHVVQLEDSVAKAQQLMEDYNIRHIPVLDGNRAIGIISQRDVFLLSSYCQLQGVLAKDVMVENPYIVTGAEDLDEVLEVMASNKYGCALVDLGPNKSEYGLGILTTVDVMNAFVNVLRGEIPGEGIQFERLAPIEDDAIDIFDYVDMHVMDE